MFTDEEDRIAYLKLQTSMGDGVQILEGDLTKETEGVIEDINKKGGYKPVIKYKRGKPFTKYKPFDIVPELPLVIGSFPFKNSIDIDKVTEKEKDSIRTGRKVRFNHIKNKQYVSLNPGVPIIFIGNMNKSKIKEIANEHPNNPIWLLGKEFKRHRVVPELIVGNQNIGMRCRTYGKPYEEPVVLQYFDRNQGEFRPTNIKELNLPKQLKKVLQKPVATGIDPRIPQFDPTAFRITGINRYTAKLAVPGVRLEDFSPAFSLQQYVPAEQRPEQPNQPFGHPGPVPPIPPKLYQSAMGQDDASAQETSKIYDRKIQEISNIYGEVSQPFQNPPGSPGRKGPGL